MIAYTLRTVRKPGLPVYQPCQQKGASFGERLANAVEEVFAQGHSNVIIVGNDSPGLNLKLLQHAIQAVKEQSMVIGPTTDGGSYLISFSQQVYQRASFIGLAWETDRLCADLLSYGLAFGQSIHQLPILSDIDSAQDLRRVRECLPKWHLLRVSLWAHCLRVQKPNTAPNYFPFVAEESVHALRGPPYLR